MMEIDYAKPPGCLMVVLGVCTLGVANLIIHLKSRRWPALADDQGLRLRDGTRIPWTEFTGAQEVTTDVGGTVVRRLDLHTKQSGTVQFPFERAHDAQRAVDTLLARMPGAAPPPSPPQPGPPGTQTYHCPACAYTWGPVGVAPYVPDAVEHQVFLVCGACDAPQARTSASDGRELECGRCGEGTLAPLDGCPSCGAREARWI